MSLKLSALPTGLMDLTSVGDGWNSNGALVEAEFRLSDLLTCTALFKNYNCPDIRSN